MKNAHSRSTLSALVVACAAGGGFGLGHFVGVVRGEAAAHSHSAAADWHLRYRLAAAHVVEAERELRECRRER